jgi:ketosteroid isomerase-like protein
MSSQAEFEVVRDAWLAFSREDVDGALRHIHLEAVVVPFGAAMEGKVYTGHEGVRDWFLGDILANWEQFEAVAEEFREVGDKLVVYGRWHARGRDSGVGLEVAATWVVGFRDGKIAFWQTFTDRDEAHRFAGLRE